MLLSHLLQNVLLHHLDERTESESVPCSTTKTTRKALEKPSSSVKSEVVTVTVIMTGTGHVKTSASSEDALLLTPVDLRSNFQLSQPTEIRNQRRFSPLLCFSDICRVNCL